MEIKNKKKKKSSGVVKEEDDEANSNKIQEKMPKVNDADNVTYKSQPNKRFSIKVEVDGVAILLLLLAIVTRFYRLSEPSYIVFDELHFGRYVGMYMRNTFFFDLHPPLGKLLVSGAAWLAGFDGKFKFEKIGTPYDETVPVTALRFVPALCGSLMVPVAYYLMLELRYRQWTAALAAFMILFDNALLTQSRFVLMEPILLFFTLVGFLCLFKFRNESVDPRRVKWWFWLTLSLVILTFALCTKYIGFFGLSLGVVLVWLDFWRMLPRKEFSDKFLIVQGTITAVMVTVVPFLLYSLVFYVHLGILTKAGPHDSVMTSSFQASLEGGLASITKGQPLEVAHGSQVTLRHSHGKACWLHSHSELYPIRYPDKRGSSHQQQVTCYTFKDLNNWWIVRRPNKTNLVVSTPPDAIADGDIVQLIHGISGRALNSHDVSAPMSPHNQEVSCYVDYNVSMPPQNLWRVDIVNKEQEGPIWHTIQSLVRLVHVASGQALKYSGRQLPEWGFNQMEIVTDKVVHQDDTVWNVEEHRYTKIDDEKERERDLMNAEMIPMKGTSLSFWTKFIELQHKMLFPSTESLQSHMYSSHPLEWPLMTRGIAYWVNPNHNGQVHLLGNIVIWYSGTICVGLYAALLVFYLLRRRRLCYDLAEDEWNDFIRCGETLGLGFLFHFLPYFFMERTLFLHHYFPALLFKILLCAATFQHLSTLAARLVHSYVSLIFLIPWCVAVVYVFIKFSVVSYGLAPLSTQDVLQLRWNQDWDFIIHKD